MFITEKTAEIYSHPSFGKVRVVKDENGEPWFVGKDVASALGYNKTRNAIADHVDENDALKQGLIDSMGRVQPTILINESGLYSLIMASKLPQAKQFKHWVTAEVLPQIRRTGGYIPTHNQQGEPLTELQIMALALQITQRTLEEKDAIIASQQPSVVFAHAVEVSVNSIGISELAKLISQNGVEIGQKRLFRWMRDKGYLGHKGEFRNIPMQRFVEQGLFEVQEYTFTDKSGHFHTTRTTKVTGKGQTYFINLFLDAFRVAPKTLNDSRL